MAALLQSISTSTERSASSSRGTRVKIQESRDNAAENWYCLLTTDLRYEQKSGVDMPDAALKNGQTPSRVWMRLVGPVTEEKSRFGLEAVRRRFKA